jgi:hypothetical protein
MKKGGSGFIVAQGYLLIRVHGNPKSKLVPAIRTFVFFFAGAGRILPGEFFHISSALGPGTEANRLPGSPSFFRGRFFRGFSLKLPE